MQLINPIHVYNNTKIKVAKMKVFLILEFEFTTKVKGHRKPVDSSIKELTISRAHMNVIRCSVSINEFKGRSTWMDEHDNRLSMALEDPVSAIRANGVAILRLRRNLSCEREGIFVCKYGPLQRQLNIKIRGNTSQNYIETCL